MSPIHRNRDRRRVVASFAAALFLVGLPCAALADVVELKGGDVVEGAVADHGDRLLVTKDDAVVSVRWRDVRVVHRDASAADVLVKRAGESAGDAAELFAVALRARRAGLVDEARRIAGRVLSADPDHKGAREMLDQQRVGDAWLGGERLLKGKGFVLRGGRWLLASEAELLGAGETRPLDTRESRVRDLLQKAASGDERVQRLAADALAGLPAESAARPALRSLRRGKTAERVLSTKLLARWGDVDAVRPLIRASVMDNDANVRAAAVAALTEIDHPETARPLGRALWSDHPQVATHAANALGEIGASGGRASGAAVEWVLRRVKTSGGPGGRNNLFVGRQISYIADFDVEIAQLAQIGDPIVGTIREGISLDTRVLNAREEFTTIERRAFYSALRRATGKDFGEDATAWIEWWKNRETETGATPAPTTPSAGSQPEQG